MRDIPSPPNKSHNEEHKIADLRRQKKRAQGRAFLGMGILSATCVGLMAIGWNVSAALCALGSIKLWTDSRRRVLEFDLEIALAELEKMEGQMMADKRSVDELEAERLAQRKMMLAGIEFNTPAGRFEGDVIYRYAVKDGISYEYAGLADAMDEPSREMLIVNDLLYKLMS
jgi:hypothetical protein